MRNFKLEDFNGAGQYLLRMSPDEIYKKENGIKFKGYVDDGFLSTIVKKSWLDNK